MNEVHIIPAGGRRRHDGLAATHHRLPPICGMIEQSHSCISWIGRPIAPAVMMPRRDSKQAEKTVLIDAGSRRTTNNGPNGSDFMRAPNCSGFEIAGAMQSTL